MNQEKIGKFIAERRKIKKLTQEELASMLGVSNRSVSNWENGKNMPDLSLFKDLCKILDISINELLSGKKINNKNEEAINNVTLSLYNAKNKKNKIIKILSFSLVIFIILFLLYYFLISYQSVKIYTVSGEGKTFEVLNGLFIRTNENLYFSISDINAIEEDKQVTKLTLFYVDKKQKKNIIVFNDKDTIMFRDYMGYDGYLDTSNLDYIMKNMYLDIYYEDTKEEIKLTFVEDYVNKKIFNLKSEKIGIEDKKETKKEIIDKDKLLISKMKEKYENEDGDYVYGTEVNDSVLSIMLLDNTIHICYPIDKNSIIIWRYETDEHRMTYQDGKGNIFDFNPNSKNLTNEEQEIIDEFYKIINESLERN